MNTILSTPKTRATINLVESVGNWHVLQKHHNVVQQIVPKGILLVDSSSTESEPLVDTRQNMGFACEVSRDGNQVLMASRLEDFPLVAIRRGLPDVRRRRPRRPAQGSQLAQCRVRFFHRRNCRDRQQPKRNRYFQIIYLRLATKSCYGEVLGSAAFEGIASVAAERRIHRLRKREDESPARCLSRRNHATFSQ